MIVQAHFNRDFKRKHPLPAQGFKPLTFSRLLPRESPSLQGLASLRSIPLSLLVASALGYLAEDTKTTTSVTGHLAQSLYI